MNMPFSPETLTGYAASRAVAWYDAIIDDMLSHPGSTIRETAKRLGRHYNTIGLIASSDLFKARYAQRRAEYNQALNDRLASKLTQVAEKALEHTITVLDQKRESVPLPLLHEITKGSLDRLGYAPSNGGAGVSVNILNAPAPQTASNEALARARSQMEERHKIINITPSPPVAGPGVEEEGED